MGCNCGGATGSGPAQYEVTWVQDGATQTKTVTTEIDAKVFAAKTKGTWRRTQ